MTHAVSHSAGVPFRGRLSLFARDIKISHTVFAMPWALLAAVLAWSAERGPIAGKLVLILICMVTARTVAMAANRLLDASLDALNPRTAGRAVPSGRLSKPFVAAALALCALLFIAATAGFLRYGNFWPLALSVPVLLFLCAYPFLKRFTRLCHYYLGAALALAPVCAWIAVSGSLDWPPVIMAGAVLLWTAGFDIIYACQDYQSDIECGVFSVPARIGIGPALWVSRITHAGCVAMLLLLAWLTPQLGSLFLAGVTLAVVLLIVEHAIVRADDLSRVGLAFFTVNGVISLLLGAAGIVDVLI